MNITFKDTSNIHSRAKKRPMASIPFSVPSTISESLPLKLNNIYEERPIKTNSTNLSFKGLSSYKPIVFDGVQAALKKFGEDFGSEAEKALSKKINDANLIEKSGLTLDGDKVSFTEKSLGKRFVDVLIYPFVKMPVDIVNSALSGLRKIPGLKNAKFLQNIQNLKALKNRREFIENTADVAGIQHYFELLKDGKNVFSEAHNRFNPLVANFDSTADRTLTRLVTGAIPAFYLANDAYNLSIFMNDDKTLAKKEKKRRFNQEAARIGITAGATYGVLSMFSKHSNGSGATTVMLMSGLTFVSEIIGRMLAGTPVLPVNEKTAKKYAKIQGKITNADNTSKSKDPKFSANSPQEANKNEEPKKKSKFTVKNFFKLMGLLAVAGFGVEKLTGIKSIKNILGSINGKYKALYTKESTISRNDFTKITDKLENQGFKGIAKEYKRIVEKQKGDLITLGREDNKLVKILIHHILTFPVRFAWSTLMAPYKNIAKPLFGAIIDAGKKIFKIEPKKVVVSVEEANAKAKKEAKKTAEKELEMLKNSIKFLDKNMKNPNFKEKVSESLISSLDNVTKSNHDNANLSAVIKNTMSAITSAFLIADNYNLVMIDSGGKNKDLAEQKARERTIQRGVRLVYGAFLIKFLNGMFAKQYNASLLGAQAVNTLYAVSTETLERTSVGLPLTESTKEEVIAKEKKNLEAKGFRGGYYKFMAKITGKKALSVKGKDANSK